MGISANTSRSFSSNAVERLFVLAERGDARALLLELRVELARRSVCALAALGLELARLRPLRASRVVASSAVFARIDSCTSASCFEIDAELIDAADARALEIAVVREHARDRGDVVLLQQQLQLLVAAERIRRAQQRRERVALRLQRGFELRALVRRARRARACCASSFSSSACTSLATAATAVSFSRSARAASPRSPSVARCCSASALISARTASSFWRASRSCAACCGSAPSAARLGECARAARERERDEQRGANDQAANSTRLWPVISAGCGRSISASTVGARSRSAP